MKLIVFLFLSFLAIASCETDHPWLRFSKPKQPEVLKMAQEPEPLKDHSRKDYLRSFYQTLFNHYNLTQPDQILECFCDKTIDLFFNSLYDTHQILIDTNERNSAKLHLEFAKLLISYRPLHDVFACVSMTQDFTDLLDALGIKERNPKQFMLTKYIYYQAEYTDLVEDFQPVVDGLDNKDHRAAGEAYANVIDNLVHDVKKKGLSWLAKEAWENGLAVKLDLDNPSDILDCFDNNSSGIYLEFMYKWAEYVTDGSWRDAPYSTDRFWEQTGRDLMKKISKEIKCSSNSTDRQKLADKIGLNVESKDFVNAMMKYVNENRFHFHMMMKGLKHSLDHYNLNHAGYVYGHFLEQIAKKK